LKEDPVTSPKSNIQSNMDSCQQPTVQISVKTTKDME